MMVRNLSSRRVDGDGSFDQRLGAVRRKDAPNIDEAALERIVTGVVTTLSGSVTLGDLHLYQELKTLGEYIQSARKEIAALRPDDIRYRHIPMATDELDAVVQATADATGIILNGMETIERLTPAMPQEMAPTVQGIVVQIYEACGFQDITGQRITKVVQALKQIETKVDSLLDVFGASLTGREQPPVPAEDEGTSLLNGPALPQGANNQDDIDAILASFD